MSNEMKECPRTGRNATAPGAFSLVIRLNTAVVDPGEKLRIEVYVSGYGEISSAKLVSYPSPDAIDQEKSTIQFNLKETDGLWTFGGQSIPLDESGVMIDLTSGGMMAPSWNGPTQFFDVPGRNGGTVPQIVTETKQSFAPVELSIGLRQGIRPGTHSVQFVLTYFNGTEWATSSETISFTVRNIYQRHEGLVWYLGLAGVVLGIGIALCQIVSPILQWFVKLGG